MGAAAGIDISAPTGRNRSSSLQIHYFQSFISVRVPMLRIPSLSLSVSPLDFFSETGTWDLWIRAVFFGGGFD